MSTHSSSDDRRKRNKKETKTESGRWPKKKIENKIRIIMDEAMT